MSANEVGTNDAAVAKVDMKFEIVVIPVSDVDRAKEFYVRLGWRLDADFDNGSDFRVIQFTPPGSGCSIIFGIIEAHKSFNSPFKRPFARWLREKVKPRDS
jgi:catechol 2,3-dioxygenase-like lactoylglutathione lyase family enzyme